MSDRVSAYISIGGEVSDVNGLREALTINAVRDDDDLFRRRGGGVPEDLRAGRAGDRALVAGARAVDRDRPAGSFLLPQPSCSWVFW